MTTGGSLLLGYTVTVRSGKGRVRPCPKDMTPDIACGLLQLCGEVDMTTRKFINGFLAALFILLLVATLIPTPVGS